VVVAIGVVGLLVSLHNLTAQVLVDIPAAVEDRVTQVLKSRPFSTLRE
jgi:hypothetical protein